MGNDPRHYDIRPDGVSATLDAVDGALDTLLATYEDMTGPVGEARRAAGSSGIVTGALDEVLTWLGERQDVMSAVVDRGITGVTDAVNAYARGDLEMARTIVASMEAVLADDPAGTGGG